MMGSAIFFSINQIYIKINKKIMIFYKNEEKNDIILEVIENEVSNGFLT